MSMWDPELFFYTYSNYDNELTCYVDVRIHIRNSGDYNINESFKVRFDHVRDKGNTLSQWFTVNSQETRKSISFDLSRFRASLNDIFSVTVDPDVAIENKKVTNIYPEDNVYLEGISVFNTVNVKTSGPVSYVEFKTNDFTFVDDTESEEGFSSLVDLGLLTRENNCVYILAYAEDGKLLDRTTRCYMIKTISKKFGTFVYTWDKFQDILNRAIMSKIMKIDFVEEKMRLYQNAVSNFQAIIPSIYENDRVIYKTLFSKNSADKVPDHLEIEFGIIPIFGGKYNLLSEKGSIPIGTIKPTEDTCFAEGSIPCFQFTCNIQRISKPPSIFFLNCTEIRNSPEERLMIPLIMM